jgi:hypothetical protein
MLDHVEIPYDSKYEIFIAIQMTINLNAREGDIGFPESHGVSNPKAI